MATTLGAMAVGSIVKINIAGVPNEFLVVQQGKPSVSYDDSFNGVTWLLLKGAYTHRPYDAGNSAEYATSDVYAYINGEFLNLFSASDKQAIKQIKIPYAAVENGFPIYSGSDGLACKVFLLSCVEVGHVFESGCINFSREGSQLSYFIRGRGADALARRSIGVDWFLRSIRTDADNNHMFVSAKEVFPDASLARYARWVRPAMVFASSTKVDDSGSVITNQPPSAPASITVPTTVKGGASLAISWGGSSDPDGNLSGYKLERSVNGGGYGQIYQGGATSHTDQITYGWGTVAYRVKAYDALGVESGYVTSPTRTVVNNSAPSAPASISVPGNISGGTSINVSWGAASDIDGNLEGYIVERSVDGGSSWGQIYQGGGTSTTNSVAFGTVSVMYRVKAYDSDGLQSAYKTSPQVTVINNKVPGAPNGINVPLAIDGGKNITITWGAASDPDGNLTGYCLERKVDAANYTEIYRGNALSHTSTITKGWGTVTFRVRAYDTYTAYGAYTTSAARTVNNNTPPTISCSSADGSDLGMKSAGFSISYTVADVDNNAVTVTEAVDGVVKRSFAVTLDASNSFAVTGDYFMKLLNGARTMTITADDGKATATHTLRFTKSVTAASVTPEIPMDADAMVTLAALAVVGHIPADAVYKVEVTNNAKDTSPAWEDCTTAVKTGVNHVFTNQTAVNGFAFNFRVNVSRGSSGEDGYITSIQGGFQ